MKDLFGEEVKESDFAMSPSERRRKYSRPRGHAAPPGSGPEGEKCGTCKHAYGIRSGSGKVYYKCDLVKPTHGTATDIRLKHPACSRWEKEEK